MHQEMTANAPFPPHRTTAAGRNRLLSDLLSVGTTEPGRESPAGGIFTSEELSTGGRPPPGAQQAQS